MDLQTRLEQLTNCVFPSDLPDYDWSKMDLLREPEQKLLLLIRLAVAAVLFVAALFLPAGGFLYKLFLILSVLVSGYDYILGAVRSVIEREPFTGSMFISIALILALAAGDRVDAAAFMILYRVIGLLAAFITTHTLHALEEAVGESPRFRSACAAPAWYRFVAPAGLIIALAVFIIQLWVAEAAPVLAARAALSVLVIANPFTLLASVPLTWICALYGAYVYKILFRSSAAMRRLLNVKSVVLDDAGTDEESLPKLVSVKSDKVPPEMLLRLAAYAEANSESRTARAILAAFHEEIDHSLIQKTLDIPQCGVEAYISNLHLFVGTRELMLLHAVSIPEEDLTDDYVVYVAVQGTYAGKLVLQETANDDTVGTLDALRSLGVRTVTLFRPAQNESVTSVAKSLHAQLFCKLTPEEKNQTLYKLQKGLPKGESLLYVERDCESRERRSPADVNICMIRGDNMERFDADVLIVDGDLHCVSETMETVKWVNGLCSDHRLLAAAVKVLLVVLAAIGCSTMWFAAVLDGAAMLTTLLLSVRAFRFREEHKRIWDYARIYKKV